MTQVEQPPVSQGEEIIRARVLELMEVAQEAMAADFKGPSIVSMGFPIILTALGQMPVEKLRSLLQCLNGISGAVLRLDSSPEEYQTTVVPLIKTLSGTE